MKGLTNSVAAFCGILVLEATAAAQAFPPDGTDVFLTWSELVITIDSGPEAGTYPQTKFIGPVTIVRSNTSSNSVTLTMTSLNLTAIVSTLGPVSLTLNGSGTGSATSTGASGFPAVSSLSVPYVLTTPMGTYTGGPHMITNTITSFPGISNGSYSVAGSTFSGGLGTGSLLSPLHEPKYVIGPVPTFNGIWLIALVAAAVGGVAWVLKRK